MKQTNEQIAKINKFIHILQKRWHNNINKYP